MEQKKRDDPMDSDRAYKSILKGALLCYYLSANEDCIVNRLYTIVDNDTLIYNGIHNENILFLKSELYERLNNFGFNIKEVKCEDNTLWVGFSISKDRFIEELDSKKKVK